MGSSPKLLPAVVGVLFAGCSSGIIPIGIEGNDGGSRDASHPDTSVDGSGGMPETGSPDAVGPSSDVGAPDGSTPACPTTEPTEASACSDVGQECEYGTNPSAVCNNIFKCTSGGWRSTAPSAACPPPDECPVAYPSKEVGDVCSPTGLVCSYPKGTCTCAEPSGPSPVDGGTSLRWRCFPEQAGCPSPRPRIGTKCSPTSTASMVCNYGACAGGVELKCVDDVWTEVMVACPAS
jgi:hypothetical protein